MPHVLVWDIETVPDLAGFAAANVDDGGKSDDKFERNLARVNMQAATVRGPS